MNSNEENIMEKYNRIKALISLDAVKYNFEQMKKNIKEGTKIIAVIKADAYGHAQSPCGHAGEFGYIWGFALRLPRKPCSCAGKESPGDSDPGTCV